MTDKQIMACGCAANGQIRRASEDTSKPGCVVHSCTEPMPAQPDLSGRTSRCYCGNERPSSRKLPFFEFCGENSREATEICACGYHEIAHKPGVHTYENGKTNHEFTPRGPRTHDRHYCGCRGWD